MLTRSQTNSLKPKTPFVGIINYPLPKELLAESNSITKPTCFIEASKVAVWKEAMNKVQCFTLQRYVESKFLQKILTLLLAINGYTELNVVRMGVLKDIERG